MTNPINYANMALEIFGSIIMAVLFICLVTGSNKKTKLHRIFMLLLLNNIAVLLTDTATYIFRGSDATANSIIVHAATFATFFFRYLFIPNFMNYVVTLIGTKTKVSGIYMKASYVMCASAVLLLIIAQFNHMYFGFDKYNNYYRGDMFWLSQAWGLLFLALSTFVILRYWKFLNKRNALFLLSYSIFPMTAIVILIFNHGFALFDAATTLSFTAIYVGIQAQQSRELREAEFARDIISAGRGHYKKMNEMRDTLRVMRHDYKYHLSAARQMLRSGDVFEADDYLSGIEARLSENELPGYCANTVINALISSYAERCGKSDIKFSAGITLPETIIVPNYELCIVLGNLLENAVEACEKREDGRSIEVIVNSRDGQLVLMVRNSFDGKLALDTGELEEGGIPSSKKKDGGLGLRSVQAVAARYGGELITRWDAEAFTAYVYLGL